MGSHFDCGRPRPTRSVSACIFLLLASGIAAPAQTPCTPGTGGYPPECVPINMLLVCGNRVTQDPLTQRETAVTMVANGCDVALVGSWIEWSAPYGLAHIGISRSLDGGRTWQAPASQACTTVDVRRFPNDCYFSNYPYGEPPAELPGDDCGYVIDPTDWTGADEEVCAGANGYLYLVGLSSGISAPGMFLARSRNLGADFDSFEFLGEAEPGQEPPKYYRRVKHVCEAYSLDRIAISASPVVSSNAVYAYWGLGNQGIAFLHSADWGDQFDGPPTLLHEPLGPLQHYAPAGDLDFSGDLYVLWTHTDGPNPNATYILMRRRAVTGEWDPALTTGDPPVPNPPRVVAGPFLGMWQFAPVGFTEYCAPSVAVDRTIHVPTSMPGPYFGWIYAVYAERGDQEGTFSRVKFVRSCDDGQTWSTPYSISPAVAHP